MGYSEITRIGNYRIKGVIGKGGMGIVLAGQKANNKSLVAIKILNPKFSMDLDFKERFRREAEIHAKLYHPNIISLKEYIENKTQCYLVMEYFKSVSLAQKTGKETGPIPYQRAIPIFIQILEGLNCLHRQNLIHRDIKPSNILINKKDEIKIIDFGIAKSLNNTNGSFKTQTGFVVGTSHYMAPEQIKGYGASPASDIYSVGITFYEALAGKYPFDYTSEYDLNYAQVHITPPFPTHFYPYIPEVLVKFVMKSIEKDKKKRHVNCESMLKELRKIEKKLLYDVDFLTENSDSVFATETSSEKEDNSSGSTVGKIIFFLFVFWLIINFLSGC